MSKRKPRTPGVDSARRALNVLLLFGGEKPWLSMDEIAEEVGVSAPSAYRFLSLLRELDLVEESGAGTYALTPRIFALASSAERAFEIGPLLRGVLPYLVSSTGEAALVIRRVGDHAICADLAQTEQMIQLSFVPGQIMSMHRGAGPKLLLASMGRPWADRYLERTGVDGVDRTRLLDELDLIRSRGWSVSSAEVDEGVWAAAAPIVVRGRAAAVLSVAGPRYRIGEDREAQILDELIARAHAVSEELDRARVDIVASRTVSRPTRGPSHSIR